MGKNVLIALAVATVVLIGGVFAFQRLMPGARNESGVAEIVIVTRDMLDGMASAQDRTLYGVADTFRTTEQPAATNQTQPAANAAPAAEGQVSEPDRQADARLLRQLFSDQLEAVLSDILTQSRRYRVANPATLQPVLGRLSADSASANQQAQGQAAAQPANQGAAARMVAGVTQMAADANTDPTQNVALAQAVREMGVSYLLSVFLERPTRTVEIVGDRLRIEADPVYVYRLYYLDERGAYALTTGAVQMPSPVSVELTADMLRADQFTARAHVDRAVQQLGLELQRSIAQLVADHVIDVMHPAHITSADPVRITRGSSRGVAVGDVFDVFELDHENAVKDNEVVIDVPESHVGAARVTAVQQNSATIELTGALALDPAKVRSRAYVVRRAGEGPGGSGGGAPAAYAAGGMGLGVNDMAQRQAGVASASVSVGQLNVRSDIRELGISNSVLGSSLSGRLARDPRITVLSRQGLDQLRREASLSNGRQSYLSSGGNIARAGFLVLGDVTVSTDRQATTVRVAGAEPRETSVTHYLVANGTLRIEASDSRLLGTYDVSARTRIASPSAATSAEASRALSEAFAAAAAEQILPNLFPIEVASVEGSVILSRGTDVGLRAGDRLTMYRLGSPVIDRHTNRQISAGARRRVGELRIDDVQDTIATASVVGDYTPSVGDIGQVGAPAAAQPARRSAPAQQQTQEPNVPW